VCVCEFVNGVNATKTHMDCGVIGLHGQALLAQWIWDLMECVLFTASFPCGS
jgi:hypothetical protein